MSYTINRMLRWQRWSGQAMVELALVLIVLLVVLFAIVQMGIVIYRYNMVCSAAREAVRYAIVHPSDTTGIKSAAKNSAPFLADGDITTSVVADPNDATKNDARVVISYSYTLKIPFIPAISLTLASSSQMLLAQ